MNLKQARQAAGISRRDLAAKLDIHDATLWRWEKGTTTINKHLLKAWAAALKSMSKKVHPTVAAGATSTPPKAISVPLDPSEPGEESSTNLQRAAPGTSCAEEGHVYGPDWVCRDCGDSPDFRAETHQTCSNWRCPICNPPEAR